MEKYIERCYYSLQKQSDGNDVEFIFVNDGSTDNTLTILESIKLNDNRVVIVNQANSGVSAARNAAIDVAKGEYVYLLDGDDFLTSNALSDIKEILNKYSIDLLISAYNISRNGIETFKELPFKEGLYTKNNFFAKISHFPTASQLVYRTDVIKTQNVRFNPSIKCGEVYEFTVNYLRFINNIYALNKPTFNYFQRNESSIHRLNYNNDVTVVNALSSIYKNGLELVNYSSFVITAFKLMCTFSYNKCLKFSTNPKDIEIIEYVLSCDVVKKCIKDTLMKPHKFTKDRMMALYMYLMPSKIGFLLINKFVKKRVS